MISEARGSIGVGDWKNHMPFQNAMFKKLSHIFIVLLVFLLASKNEATPLKINIFSFKNGLGLEKDQQILADILRNWGHSVECRQVWDPIDGSYADINIFFEILNPSWRPYASLTWFIPNPECYEQSLDFLNEVDLILCRTKEVERIFKSLQKKTFFLGFTSQDCYQPEIAKDFSQLLHLAGCSPFKGTFAILDVWIRNPLFPHLTIIKRQFTPLPCQSNIEWITKRVEESVLRQLQNTCGIHLCLSETEGFGHYIMEAMSAGAVVITTNAPPMNEFIMDKRCLVPYGKSKTHRLGKLYLVHEGYLELTINQILQLSTDELIKMGSNNREIYLKKTEEFKNGLKLLLSSIRIKLQKN